MKVKELFGGLKDGNVLVVGDVMLDKYIHGDVNRISPEAPVQVLDVKKEESTLGGAANTCYNVMKLGCKVSLCGVVGNDDARDQIISHLSRQGIDHSMVVTDKTRKTTQKIRVVGMNQQLVRIDYEDRHKISNAARAEVLAKLNDGLNGQHVIIVSDYAKGFIMQDLVKALIQSGKKVLVDPKPKNIDFYKGAFLIKPNLKESMDITGIVPHGESDFRKMGFRMMKMFDSNILITAGEKGMYLFEKNGNFSKMPSNVREVYDVSGAGDTVIATIASCMAAGATLKEAAVIANYAAGIVVGKYGTATVTPDEILSEMRNDRSNSS